MNKYWVYITRRFFLLLTPFFLLLTSHPFLPVFAQETPLNSSQNQPLVIINQVRGPECCEPGNLDNFQLQINTLNQLGFPATFALRYDALINPNYTNTLIASGQQPGLLIEITPALAKTAKVLYPGPEKTWYKANQAFLVGYSPDDRKNIIDTLMATFKNRFGYYPQTTVSWLIDADSLAYLANQYNVKVHQITREQWGTDSYTLYGGPPSHPYFPSSNWPLIPTLKNQSLPTLIVRQTLADPLLNYGDTSASFTSQPNDYLNSGKQLWYFKALINQTITQAPIVLGLENSMDAPYQQEFTNQLNWLDQNNYRPISIAQLVQSYQPPPITIVKGQDLVTNDPNQQAFWVTTPNYRLRLRRAQNKLAITDLRIYHSDLTDPYKEASSSTQNAYWIAPFLLDASRYQRLVFLRTSILQKIKQLIKPLPTKPLRPEFIFNPQLDDLNSCYQISLPSIDSTSSLSIDQQPEFVNLNYTSNSKPVSLKFSTNYWQLDSPFSPQLIGEKTYSLPYHKSSTQPFHWLPQIILDSDQNKTHLSWQNQNESLWRLEITKTDHFFIFTPRVGDNLDLDKVRHDFPNELAPETAYAPADPIQTEVEFHNLRAIANRNPIRFFINPRDKIGIPTKAVDPQIEDIKKPLENITIQPPTSETGQIWVDINQTNPGSHQVQVYLNDQFISSHHIRFVTNCAINKTACLTRPLEALRFLVTKIEERQRLH